MPERRTYPHCDPCVLHKPGTCETCDEYAADLQEVRKTWHIVFTGEEPQVIEEFGFKIHQIQCPSTLLRSVDTINRWSGNRPQASEATEILGGLKPED